MTIAFRQIAVCVAFKQTMYERNEGGNLSYVSLHPEDTYYVKLSPTCTAQGTTRQQPLPTHRKRQPYAASHAINSSQPQRIRHTQ